MIATAPAPGATADPAIAAAAPAPEDIRARDIWARAEPGIQGARLSEWPANVSAGRPGGFSAGADDDPGGDEEDRLRRQGAEGGSGGVAAAPSRPSPAPAEDSARTEGPAPRSPIEQVVARVDLMRREGRQAISLQLDPPDLGVVRIEAALQGGHLTLEIRAELSRGRDVLEQALPQIRQSLADLGMVSGQVSVHLGLDASTRESPWREFAAFRESLPAPSPRSGQASAAPRSWHQPSPAGFDFRV